MKYNAGLILEGGGMKGVYTAGIIDYLIDEEIEFGTCYGVSAGACHVCSYVAKMRDRAFSVFADFWKYKEFGGLYSFLTTGDWFGADMLYNRIPNELYRLDYDTIDKSETDFIAVATDIHTGKAKYFKVEDLRKDMIYVRASSSMPIISRNVEIDGKFYLDGGCSDAIPLKKSIEDGYDRNVVVLTKKRGYIKEKTKWSLLAKFKYRKYPEFIDTFNTLHEKYNETMEFIDKEEEEGRIFVFRPHMETAITSFEKDWKKLRALYEMGYEDAVSRGEDLKKYLLPVQKINE